MSAIELLERVKQQSESGDLDWRFIREEVHNELDKKPPEDEVVLLLSIFNITMDLVERQLATIDPEKLADLQKARLGD